MLCCCTLLLPPQKIFARLTDHGGNSRERAVFDGTLLQRNEGSLLHTTELRNHMMGSGQAFSKNPAYFCSILLMQPGMVEFNERTQPNMDVVLEEICTEFPHGGDHESRKFIAEQLNAPGVAELRWVS
jgi:hypothetical protein